MLIRMGLNYGVHAAAGVATAGLLVLAAEGWRRACKAGNGPSMAGRGRHDDGPDPEVARHDWIDEEATGGPATGSTGGGAGSA
jgi:hypothetical protein